MLQPDVKTLQGYAASDEFARRAFEVLANRQRKRGEITVEVLMSGLSADRMLVVKFLQRLESLGYGQFILGRGSKQSRLRWRYTMSSVGMVALGRSTILEEMPYADDGDSGDNGHESESEGLSAQPTNAQKGSAAEPAAAPNWPTPPPRKALAHTFPLAADRMALLELPVDLTAAEARRLAAFVQALAVEPQSQNGASR
ncbi:MAG: hypothetical protein ACP5QA_15395 [Phycisphaerae bacterium]